MIRAIYDDAAVDSEEGLGYDEDAKNAAVDDGDNGSGEDDDEPEDEDLDAEKTPGKPPAPAPAPAPAAGPAPTGPAFQSYKFNADGSLEVSAIHSRIVFPEDFVCLLGLRPAIEQEARLTKCESELRSVKAALARASFPQPPPPGEQ